MEQQETIAVTTDVEHPGSEQTRVERLVSQLLPLDSIVCGDNCDVLGTFPRDCIDLVVTSPPYDDLRTYGGHAWDFYGVAWQLKRVLKPGGVIVWVVADQTKDGSETGTSFEQALHFKRLGLNLHDTMVYQKTSGGVNGSLLGYLPCWEFMFVLSAGTPARINLIRDRKNVKPPSMKREDCARRKQTGERKDWDLVTREEYGIRWNVWPFDVGNNLTTKDGFAFEHPALFPEKLAADHIRSWSNEGDIVLDPFNGSGTTTKMARLMGRRFIGIDVNADYCEIARKRLAQKLLDFGDAG